MSRTPIAPGLREAADLMDAHPDLVQPYLTTGVWGRVRLSWYLTIDTDDDAEQKVLAVEIVRAVGGKWDKGPDGEHFNLRREHGLLDLHVQVRREAVCEKVVVGVETVTIPATEAADAQPERTEEREVVEWRCDEPLLAVTR